jgi:exonuclease III
LWYICIVPKKRLDVFNWAKSKNASIVCFQETHSTKDIVTRWEDEWSGKCYFSHGDSKSAGVSIMFRSGLDTLIWLFIMLYFHIKFSTGESDTL